MVSAKRIKTLQKNLNLAEKSRVSTRQSTGSGQTGQSDLRFKALTEGQQPNFKQSKTIQ